MGIILELLKGHFNPTPSILSTENYFDPYNSNWTKGSRMLPNVAAVYTDIKDCPPSNNTLAIGLDPGRFNAVTATRINPHRGNLRQIDPTTLDSAVTTAHTALDDKKNDIWDIERPIPTFQCASI